jgi:hypothetical protein
VTLLLASSCFLACATAVSNSPRILYQLAIDGYVAPVFAIVSRRGVLQPGLIFCVLINLIALLWIDLTRLLVIGSVGFVVMLMSLNLGLWLRRGAPEVRWPWLALGFLIFDGVVLLVGGLAWSREDVLIGLLFPMVVFVVDAAIRRIPFAPFHPEWWIQRYRQQRKSLIPDFCGVSGCSRDFY